jgi:hypothetical protein
MIMSRQKYPRWWFDWNLELSRFSSRVSVYLALMDDQYPSGKRIAGPRPEQQPSERTGSRSAR